MKIFIATSFEAKNLFHEYRDVLVKLGHNVYDWTAHPSVRPYKLHMNLVKEHAKENIEAAVSADCFILVTDTRSRSSFVELGAAIHSACTTGNPKIFIIGNDISMYVYHPVVNYIENLNGVITWLKNQQ
jgi:hypothetical protein